MVKTVHDVVAEFHRKGMTVTQWAAKHHFSRQLVYAVLRGDRKCFRGQSHQIAVALGIKDGEPSSYSNRKKATK